VSEPKLVLKFKGTVPEDQDVDKERSAPIGPGAAMAAPENTNTNAERTLRAKIVE
jgi:hypothetical protein